MTKLVLIKHALPILDAERPSREWELGETGEQQARQVAAGLRARLPFTLVSSEEPKARRTAQIIAEELGVAHRAVAGLHELDRPVLPVLDAAEHARVNRPIFEDQTRAMLGDESANDARQRFSAAIGEEVARLEGVGDLVVVTHGTVMALFAGTHSPVDPWKLWQRLECGDALEFALPGLRLVGGVSADEAVWLAQRDGRKLR